MDGDDEMADGDGEDPSPARRCDDMVPVASASAGPPALRPNSPRPASGTLTAPPANPHTRVVSPLTSSSRVVLFVGAGLI